MAAVAPPADQAADFLQNLSLDSHAKALEVPPETAKKPAVDSVKAANSQIQSTERSTTPSLQDCVDPAMCYLPSSYPSNPYYYGGYGGTGNEWEEYSRYINPEGVEMPPGVYGDNGSFMYSGYGYASYGPYSPASSPVPTMGHDGQLYGAQHYQYPTQFLQPLTPNSAPYNPTPAALPKGEIPTAASADQAPLSVDIAKGNSSSITTNGAVKGKVGSVPAKQKYQNSSFTTNSSYGRGGFAASGFQDPRTAFDGMKSPNPWLDGSMFSDGYSWPVTSTSMASSRSHANNAPASRNQNFRPHSHLTGLHQHSMGTTNGYTNNIYPNKLYGHYGSTFRTGFGFGSNAYDSRTYGHGWLSFDNKYKSRGRSSGVFGYGNENIDGMNELNRGPRAKSSKDQKGFVTTVPLAVKGQNIPLNGTDVDEKDKSCVVVTPGLEQYNKVEFPESYSDAKFFIIKSYSEDDVHKSIKYDVWASTPNGNRKLDAAYQEALQKSGGCPVFLFFSVNTSGQFVGVAEMIGPVDFENNFEYWQQDKWNGCFPVKWHIVKDVSNSLLKHIILENNENKPVTNSRDTQEVKLEQGLQMLKIFKDHSSKTCILNDFVFYEGRQKTIQEKKAKQQQFQKQAWEGKTSVENGEQKSQKPLEAASDFIKEPALDVQTNGDVKLFENGSVTSTGDGPKDAKLAAVLEKRVVANCC
ncbi:hypothetical protein RHSIM_Rhsim01G0184000 [Rhododendron simsii]|uniref:YTH domain-containing family protein n=1 Tax=Rhododendron simsii TaxID=118357 RepID=A0A834HLU8_RHOSS|nr:hypothetical protein RHSIM_Rhsim01G0184000 [Rhododendron simsii]